MRFRQCLILLSLASVSSPLGAQGVTQQANALTTPAYTDLQRWNRENFLTVNFFASSIAYAKARGQTVDDLARFLGDRYAPGWGPANSGVAVRVARGILLNVAAMPGTEATLVGGTDTSATVRFRRSHVALFGADGVLSGVTLAEYDRLLTLLNEHIASYLGLRYSERMDGDWATITVTGRGTNALVSFPRDARFTATLSAEQAGAANLAGTYDLLFMPDGRFELTSAGTSKVRGRYDVQLDQVVLHEETGELACVGMSGGTYRYTPQANGDIVFGRLADTCDGRGRFVARRWAKK